LVWGGLAANFVRVFMSYIIHPYRPRIKFEKEKFQELFGFGKWILSSSILTFLITQGDDIFVGKMLGVTFLGFYQMAYLISNLPATEITQVISQVTFPAYSKLQDDLPKLREAYLKILQLIAFVSVPLAGVIFILAPEFTNIFLGEKWMPMVATMQALVLWGLIRAIGATTSPIFHGMGRPWIATKLQFVQLSLLAILIYPLSIRWGILGASLAVVFAALVANIVGDYIVIKITRCGVKNFFKMIVFPMINMGIMISGILILKTYWLNSVGILEFCLLVIFGVLIYFGTIYLSDRLFVYGVFTTIKEICTRLREEAK